MKKKSYTVGDVDSLRSAVRDIYLFGSAKFSNETRMSRSYREDEMAKTVEEQVRTYMLAGITADDL